MALRIAPYAIPREKRRKVTKIGPTDKANEAKKDKIAILVKVGRVILLPLISFVPFEEPILLPDSILYPSTNSSLSHAIPNLPKIIMRAIPHLHRSTLWHF
jgi:hypothetical protein